MKYKIYKQKIINNNILLNVELGDQDLTSETAWIKLAHFIDLELRRHGRDAVTIINSMRELEYESKELTNE